MIVPTIPEDPPCSRPELICLSARALYWAERVCEGQRFSVVDVLVFAAARWAARRDRGCSELYRRFAGMYAAADKLEREPG